MSKKAKEVKQRESASTRKSPRIIENPESFYEKVPVWSFKLIDNDCDKWGLTQIEDMSSTLIEKLKSFEGMTWGEIIKASGGRKNGNNNHYEDVSALIPEAQKRWKELRLEQYDKVFSLRLTGTQRLYGILLDGVFRIVWFDPEHEIYAIQK